MNLGKWILLITAVVFFLIVGLEIFPPLQTAIRTLMPPNATDMPIVALGRASMPYILVVAIIYGTYRLWKTKGQ